MDYSLLFGIEELDNPDFYDGESFDIEDLDLTYNQSFDQLATEMTSQQ